MSKNTVQPSRGKNHRGFFSIDVLRSPEHQQKGTSTSVYKLTTNRNNDWIVKNHAFDPWTAAAVVVAQAALDAADAAMKIVYFYIFLLGVFHILLQLWPLIPKHITTRAPTELSYIGRIIFD